MTNHLNVAKFGGTSMANLDTMLKCAKVVLDNKNTRVAVVSASSGVTNLLVSIINDNLNQVEKESKIDAIKQIQNSISEKLQSNSEATEKVEQLLVDLSTLVRSKDVYSPSDQDEILSFGERMSSEFFAEVLRSLGVSSVCFDIRKVLKTDDQFSKATPITSEIKRLGTQHIKPLLSDHIIVTQGFIGSDSNGNTTTLGRGGSDYTAALVAEGLSAATCEIWTDVKGVYTIDPRLVPDAKLIPELSFEEAAEMANFGAKVLHPATMIPALRSGVSVFVGSSFDSKNGGTWLVKDCEIEPTFRAITIRKNQMLVTIKSPSMQFESEFTAKVFGILTKTKLNTDLITSSETSISFSIDNTEWKNADPTIKSELASIGTVHTEVGYCLITVVGNHLNTALGKIDKIFTAIDQYPVRLICYGANPHNISFLMMEKDTNDVVMKLHSKLF